MVDYNSVYTLEGVTRTKITGEEKTQLQAKRKAVADNSANIKLELIKEFRLEKLKETDWYSNSDVTMPDNIKTWRQSLRDIPANHTDENAYDLLLARDSNGNLTHSIWSKP
tara:strand:- start:850 stop:1182 length:333 start_codon:yes stop_codon:yes gene_type:complete